LECAANKEKSDYLHTNTPPYYLDNLLNGEGENLKCFRENIWSYYSMFSLTFTGGIVRQRNKLITYEPYASRIHGQNYHHNGTLLPKEGTKPRWAQLYIYNTENEVQNRIAALRSSNEKTPVNPTIVAGLQRILDENNVVAQSFRMARERFKNLDYHDYTLKLIVD